MPSGHVHVSSDAHSVGCLLGTACLWVSRKTLVYFSAFMRPLGVCKCVITELGVHVLKNLVGPQERLAAVQGCMTDSRIHMHVCNTALVCVCTHH